MNIEMKWRKRQSSTRCLFKFLILFADVWDLERFNYLWPTENEGVLFKNHTLDEYGNEVKETPVKYSVFVQVLNKSPEEASKCYKITTNCSVWWQPNLTMIYH